LTFASYRSDWIRYIVPAFLLLNAGFILYLRYIKKFGRGNTPMVVVPAPPPSSTVGQLMSLQQAIAFVEYALQDVNIALLKTQALFFSEFTQVSEGRVSPNCECSRILDASRRCDWPFCVAFWIMG
jgi:hypothetical protein